MERFVSIRCLALTVVPAAILLVGGCSEEEAGGLKPRPPQGRAESAATDSMAPSVLAGTRWRLVEIREGSNRAVQPDDPEKYIFNFRPDGTLAMRLNCNRASGDWMASSTGKAAGVLTVGPTARTRAMCPSPSLDIKIAHDIEYVRSYRLEDNTLMIALKAGGGTYIMERMGPVERNINRHND